MIAQAGGPVAAPSSAVAGDGVSAQGGGFELSLDSLRVFLDIPKLTTTIVEFLPRLGTAVLLLVFFWLFFRATKRALELALSKGRLHPKMVELLIDKLYRYTVMIIGIVMAADQLGVNVAAALAGIGIAGIALGFAAQDTVANIIAGILIFWDRPFSVGDWVTTEGRYGQVSNITLRTTRIRTPRNTFVVIPNKRIIDEVLENFSKHGEMRIDVPVGIAYKEDVLKARDVLLEAVRDMPQRDPNREPDVVVDALGNSSVDLLVRVWIRQADDKQATEFQVVERAKLALDRAGIQIPFPHLQLFVDNVEDRVFSKASEWVGRR